MWSRIFDLWGGQGKKKGWILIIYTYAVTIFLGFKWTVLQVDHFAKWERILPLEPLDSIRMKIRGASLFTFFICMSVCLWVVLCNLWTSNSHCHLFIYSLFGNYIIVWHSDWANQLLVSKSSNYKKVRYDVLNIRRLNITTNIKRLYEFVIVKIILRFKYFWIAIMPCFGLRMKNDKKVRVFLLL